MTKSRALAALAVLALLPACASKPKPQSLPSAEAPVMAPSPGDAEASPSTRVVTSRPPTTTQSGAIPGSLADFRVTVAERVFFDTDQYSLRPDARATLEKQAAWLKAYPRVRIMVAGHADERGTREYNLALGARRAAATKDYLVSLGVDGARIDTVSYGKERPFAAGSDDQSWALNRNAHTQIVGGAQS